MGNMPLPPDFLRRFDAKRSELSQLRDRVAVMEAELRGWEEAASALGASSATDFADASRDSSPFSPPVPSRTAATPRVRRSWQALLKETAKRYPADVTLDDMERMSGELGNPTTRNTLRSQMSIYTTQRLVERTGQGRYRLTRVGAEALGIQLPMAQATTKPQLESSASDLLDMAEPVSDDIQEQEKEG